VANALMGVQRESVDFARRRVVAGARNPGLARSVRNQIVRAMVTLERGLADYGTEPVSAPK
jgi:hypothetical protein